jgi:hypothetical protein
MRNNKITVIFFILSLAITVACTNSSQKQDDTNQGTTSSTSSAADVLTSYYELKDALVETNSSLAKEKAMNLTSALKKENNAEELIRAAEAIAGSDNIKTQRIEFEKLSAAIYTLAKASTFGDATIYKQYCPMAFGNKGAFWLSDEKEIMNPYFGDKMLHCGKVEETIAKL